MSRLLAVLAWLCWATLAIADPLVPGSPPTACTIASCPVSVLTNLGLGVATALTATLNGSGALTATTNPAFVTPNIGVATATSIAVGGATLGANALAVAGSILQTTANSALFRGSLGVSFGVGTSDTTMSWQAAGYFVGSSTGIFGLTNGVTGTGTPDTIFSRKAAANWQFGAADAATSVAQTISFQGIVAGTSNTSGSTATIVGSLSTGSGTSGDIDIRTGGTGAGATVPNSSVSAILIKGATQQVRLPQITSDAAQTDATICEDTTNHALFSGSGTLGICLGTSSARYKHDVSDLGVGLHAIMGLQPKRYFLDRQHGDPAKPYYGFLAEDGVGVLPELVGNDNIGRPNTFDYLGIVPILVRAVQEQQAEIQELRRMVR